MIIKGITVGHNGGVTKHSILVPKGVNTGELIEDLRHFYGWGNIKVIA